MAQQRRKMSEPISTLIVAAEGLECDALCAAITGLSGPEALLECVATAEAGLDRIGRGGDGVCVIDCQLLTPEECQQFSRAAAARDDAPALVMAGCHYPASNSETPPGDQLLAFPSSGRLHSPDTLKAICSALMHKRLQVDCQWAKRESELMKRVSAIAARPGPLDETLADFLSQACRSCDWQVGHVYLRKPDDQTFHPTEYWYPPQPTSDLAFRELTHHCTFELGEGLIGRVVASKSPECIANVHRDGGFVRVAACSETLKSVVAIPVSVEGEVVAVLEFLADREIQPDKQLLEVLHFVGEQAGRIFERHFAARQLHWAETRFRTFFDHIFGALALVDPRGAVVDVNQPLSRASGLSRDDLVGRTLWELPWWRRCPQEQTAVQDLLRRAVAGETLRHRSEGETAAGVPCVVDSCFTPIRDMQGNVVMVIVESRDVTQQEQTESLHKQLVDLSRDAGMAEVATGVLHNVGNVLNSVNVSSRLICDRLRHSPSSGLHRVTDLLRTESLATDKCQSNRTRQLLNYLKQLDHAIDRERAELKEELTLITANIEHMNDIVLMQQAYARMGGTREPVDIEELVEDALRINQAGLHRHSVEVQSDFEAAPRVTTEKHKVLQVLVNLISNAKYALGDAQHGRRVLRIRIRADESQNGENRRVRIFVEDNGCGIAESDLPKIFEHGFTTRKDGHGFGLHTAALAATELGGTLHAHSEGPGKGATFTFEVPVLGASLCPA